MGRCAPVWSVLPTSLFLAGKKDFSSHGTARGHSTFLPSARIHMIAPAEPAGSVAVILSEAEARELTDQIRSTAEDLCDLLYRAHEGKAYRALGYPSWQAYVSAEFSMSRTNAYELLGKAKVVRALSEASGGAAPDISTATARRIGPQLAEIVDDVRARISTGEHPEGAVENAVRSGEQSAQMSGAPDTRSNSGAGNFDDVNEADRPDLLAEYERAERENADLRSQVETLSATDAGAVILSWQQRYAALNGRLDLALRQKAEAERTAKYQSEILGKVRRLLSVERNGEIVGALTDLLR